MSLPAAILSSVTLGPAFRIAPEDTNYFVILFDPQTEKYENICVIEIFDRGGATPPNRHEIAHEFFYVLHGEGNAHSEGKVIPIRKGSALLLRPGAEHVIENTGNDRLYTLTVMTPNEEFSELIRLGEPVELDTEDLAILIDYTP
tara:strand:+ start:14379 stop:14813 length:435 start_codon:yes stop_codon:yes gene_type:complete